MPPSQKPNEEILRSLQEMATRADEKIMSLMDRHEKLLDSDEKLGDRIEAMSKDLTDLKIVVASISDKLRFVGGIGEKIFDDAWKLVLTIIGAAILWMLGFQSK